MVTLQSVQVQANRTLETHSLGHSVLSLTEGQLQMAPGSHTGSQNSTQTHIVTTTVADDTIIPFLHTLQQAGDIHNMSPAKVAIVF